MGKSADISPFPTVFFAEDAPQKGFDILFNKS